MVYSLCQVEQMFLMCLQKLKARKKSENGKLASGHLSLPWCASSSCRFPRSSSGNVFTTCHSGRGSPYFVWVRCTKSLTFSSQLGITVSLFLWMLRTILRGERSWLRPSAALGGQVEEDGPSNKDSSLAERSSTAYCFFLPLFFAFWFFPSLM